MFPPTADAQGSYTWATSLSRHVSGLEILRAANAETILQSHACDLFHGGVNIPIGHEPAHWMQNGHSFVAVFQDLQGARGFRNAHSASSSHNDVSIEETTTQLSPDSNDADEPEESAEESSQLAGSSFDEEDLKGLHVFGLMQPARHCFVRWTTYTNILLDVLREVGLHRDLAIGFHHVQVPLIDQHVEEEAIILQRVGDIPPGAPDQLAVVDIVFEEPNVGQEPPPRQVLRLPRFASRSTVLQCLHLDAICNRDSPETSCLLFLNRIFWDQDDEAPRELTHGIYLRVIVLPPKGRNEASAATRVCDFTDPSSKRQRTATGRSPGKGSVPTGSSLLQISADVQDAHQGGPKMHSATFPSLAITNGQRAAQVLQTGRTIPPINTNWLTPLRDTFHHCSVIEFQDEGPVQYWTTWFLHHDRYPRNSESRILRLDSFRQHWYNDLRNLWSDVIDQSRAAWVHLVLPTPPSESQQQSVGHILLVQGEGDAIPTLLTAVFDHPVHRRIWHAAAFVPQYADHNDPIDILGLRRICSSRTCHFQAGTAPWPEHEAVLLQPGDSITVTIMAIQQMHEEDSTTLMQIGSTPARASASNEHFAQSDVLPSPLTIPRTMPSRMERLWRDQITEYFEKNAVIEMEEEGQVLYVWTWLINHQTAKICQEPEAVRLTAQSDQWREDILAPWTRQLQQDVLTHINVVSPYPWNDRFRIDSIHLMIEQHPREAVVAGIITTFLHGPHGDRIDQKAYSLPRWLCTNDIIDHLGINHVCDTNRCTAMAGIQHFDQYIRHDVYTAISIELHVQPPHCLGHAHAASAGDTFTRKEEERDDVANFLQRMGGERVVMLMEDPESLPDHHPGSQVAHGRLTTQTEHLQTIFSSMLRLLGDRMIDRPECPYETPAANLNHLQPTEMVDGRHLDDLFEVWYNLSPVFAASEEEATVSFTTWYVHAPLWPTCYQSRPLVLSPHSHTWDSQIRELWRDKIQPGQTFEVSVAHPESEHDQLHHILASRN